MVRPTHALQHRPETPAHWRRRALVEIQLRILVEERAAAWQAVARNLAQALGDNGIAALRNQMRTHGLGEKG